jgi:PAS domain S-box-containing protein
MDVPIEEKFRMALELSPDGFAILRTCYQDQEVVDFIWEYLNPSTAKIFKINHQEVLGKSITQTLPAIKSSDLFLDWKQVIKEGRPFEAEVSYQTKELSGWLRTSAVKLGESLAVSLRDITDQKVWQESLKQSEARFQTLAQSSMMGLAFWSTSGEILDANEAFLKLLGYSREDFFNQDLTFKDLTPSEYWAADAKADKELRQTGSCLPYEKELIRSDKSRVPVLWGMARLTAINLEGVAFVLDISERKAIDKEREILLGHELKTPLAGIKAFAQLLIQRQAGKDDKTLSYLTKIDDKVDELMLLVSDLTDFTRIRSSSLEFTDELFELDGLVEKAVADCQLACKTHTIILKGQTKKVVKVDPVRFNQVMSNLLSNAIKYSPQADEVIVSLSANKKETIVAIKDFGFGIPAKDQEKIFEPFGRCESTKKKVPGVGLGLHICSEIVKHYNGRIDVESTEGEGSTFAVRLPVLTP